jgi:hypothetical protein
MPISQIVTNSIANNVSVTFTAGSAAAPAVTTTGDTNTGIFFPAADTIAFAEGGAEVARFDSSGNLGVGTTSPARRLHVRGGAGLSQFESTGSACYVYVGDSTSSSIDNQGIGSIGNNLIALAGGNERMRIDSSGRVFAATTNTAPSVNNVYGVVLNSNGDGVYAAGVCQFSANGSAALNLNRGSDDGTTMSFRRTGTLVGAINVTGSSTSYVTSSDYRLKENIAPMTDALAKVSALKPCTYTWKEGGQASQGFIAHELQEVCPDAVVGEKDAVNEDGSINPQGIDTSFLVATLTAAIQELKAELDTVKTELAVLKG